MSYQRPPGPKGHFIWGNLRQFQQSPPRYLLQIAYQYGDIVYLRLAMYHCYLVTEPTAIHEVLVTQQDKFQKGRFDKAILSKFLGNGILLSEGDFWRRQRRLSQPAFHSKRIAAYADTMVAYTNRRMAQWHDGAIIQIDAEMMQLTMEIVSKTLFDHDIYGMTNNVGQAIAVLQEIANREFQSVIPIPDWLPIPHTRYRKAAKRELDAIVNYFIQARRAEGEADRGDLLSMLLLARGDDDERMDDQQLRDEAVTLFSAGHETTSNALTWAAHLLSQHPELAEKLYQEVDSVLDGRPARFDDVRNLTYTAMIIKETLRLYPPAWVLIGREALEDVKIGAYIIPKGSRVFISPYVMHRLPRYWDEPERFYPERFAPEREAQISKYVYLPFGGGPRICIGNSFAMMEAILALATMAQRWRFLPLAGQSVAINPQITMSPKGGLRLRLQARAQNLGQNVAAHDIVSA